MERPPKPSEVRDDVRFFAQMYQSIATYDSTAHTWRAFCTACRTPMEMRGPQDVAASIPNKVHPVSLNGPWRQCCNNLECHQHFTQLVVSEDYCGPEEFLQPVQLRPPKRNEVNYTQNWKQDFAVDAKWNEQEGLWYGDCPTCGRRLTMRTYDETHGGEVTGFPWRRYCAPSCGYKFYQFYVPEDYEDAGRKITRTLVERGP